MSKVKKYLIKKLQQQLSKRETDLKTRENKCKTNLEKYQTDFKKFNQKKEQKQKELDDLKTALLKDQQKLENE